jgi:hypothetical protein
MKSKVTGCLLFGLVLVLAVTISARPDGRDRDDRDRDREECRDVEHNATTPLEAIGVIPVPGAAVTSTDIAWVDPGTERLYFSDRSNKGVDVINAENDTFVGRVSGFAGNVGVTNGSGPGGVLVTPDRKLFAGDGNTKVEEADVDPTSADYLKIIKSFDLSTGQSCAPTCGRADEVGYDPKDHKVLAAIDGPTVKGNPGAPYAALIDANTGAVKFVTIPNITAGGGLEQPLWDGELGVFFLTVPSVDDPVTNKPTGHGEIALINPNTAVVTGSYTKAFATAGCGPTGEVLAPYQRLVTNCGGNLLILNATNGNLITTVKGVSSDELWFNPGDDLVYATNSPNLYAVDPKSGTVFQTINDPGGRNMAAFAENNHVFTPVRAAAGDQCTQFGVGTATTPTGCVAVFAHREAEGGGK